MGRYLWFVAAFTTGAASAAGVDPRLELALSTNLIANIDRSVQFDKTIPPVRPAKPAVDSGQAVRMAEDVYVDRSLAPKQPAAGDEKAIRVFPRDKR